VTRYRSGGVLGSEKDRLNGVAGRVVGPEAVPPMKVSACWLISELRPSLIDVGRGGDTIVDIIGV